HLPQAQTSVSDGHEHVTVAVRQRDIDVPDQTGTRIGECAPDCADPDPTCVTYRNARQIADRAERECPRSARIVCDSAHREVRGGVRYRHDVPAAVIVFHRDEDGCRFLLVLSRLTKRPLWEFPKGGVDTGESLEEAALRELHEETGLTRDDIRLVPGFERREEYRFTTGDDEPRTLIRKEVTYYLAEAMRTDVRIAEAEASEYAWLRLQDALRKLRYPGRRRLLEDAARAAGCLPSEQGAPGS